MIDWGSESRMIPFDYFEVTLPETNIAPENKVSQKETSIPTIHFQGRTVSFREVNQAFAGTSHPTLWL